MLSGSPYGSVESAFTAAPDLPMSFRGVNLGRHQLNAGIGARWYFGAAKRVYVFADYDLDYSRRMMAHTGQAGIVWNF
jgi:hypothetical protein